MSLTKKDHEETAAILAGKKTTRKSKETVMANMTMSEMVKEYNKLVPKKHQVTKFADKATALKRLKKARKDAGVVPKKKKAVAKKRATGAQYTRHNVKVGGKVYRSVKAAFEALKLPLGVHIKFRMKLKANGHNTINGKKFTLVTAK